MIKKISANEVAMNNKQKFPDKNIMPKGNYNKIYEHKENSNFKKEMAKRVEVGSVVGINYDGTPSTEILYYKIVPVKYGYDLKGRKEYKSVDINSNLIAENSALAKIILGLSRGDDFKIETITGIETGRIVFID